MTPFICAATWIRRLSAGGAYSLAAALFIAPLSTHSQERIQLATNNAPAPSQAAKAMQLRTGEALRIENLRIEGATTGTTHLNLRRSEVVNAETQFIVVDDNGPRKLAHTPNAHFIGTVEGDPSSFAFASISPNGEIRTIIHQGDDIIVNEILSTDTSTGVQATSRRVDFAMDFASRDFSCGVDLGFFKNNAGQRKIAQSMLSAKKSAESTEPLVAMAAPSQRRADIIIDTDYELFQKFGSETATANYITNLLTYISSRYEAEIYTRLQIKQLIIRPTSADPWTATSSSAMLDEVMTYWNTAPYASITRNHVHFMSGKSSLSGVAYVGTLGYQSYAYGVSSGISGSFSPSNPQVIWDSVVVAHEMGHAFGSSHTHDYDNPFIAPSPNTGGAIDCCYSSSASSQCGIALGGGGRAGYLPGPNATTGGGAGQRNGTIMSYCHLVPAGGGMSNIAWSFGTGHAFGVNPSRAANVMLTQAQTYLPLDAAGPYTLTISKTGSGSVTSNPTGITCGSDCTESYASGTSVTLTAVPDSGNTFSGWSGDCSGTGTCTVTMSAAKSVGATFTAIPTVTITAAKVGNGSGTVTRSGGTLSCGSTCSESLSPGSTVTLTATPGAGSTFVGWSGGTCSGNGSCAFTLNANTTVTAQFNTSTGGPTTSVVQNNRSGSAGTQQSYAITVPAGAKNLLIQTSGGSGNVNLYVRYGQAPTTSTYDCRGIASGNQESCVFATPTAGTYYVMLHASSAFSGVSLAMSYQKKAVDLSPIIHLLLN